MATFRFGLAITLKPGVPDAASEVARNSLVDLVQDPKFQEGTAVVVSDVKAGKYISVQLDSESAELATVQIRSMCDQLLVGKVAEQYDISRIEEKDESGTYRQVTST